MASAGVQGAEGSEREHVEKRQLMGLSEQHEAQRTDCSKEGGVPKSVPLRSLELLWHLSLADREDHYPRVSGALGGTLPPPRLALTATLMRWEFGLLVC